MSANNVILSYGINDASLATESFTNTIIRGALTGNITEFKSSTLQTGTYKNINSISIRITSSNAHSTFELKNISVIARTKGLR